MLDGLTLAGTVICHVRHLAKLIVHHLLLRLGLGWCLHQCCLRGTRVLMLEHNLLFLMVLIGNVLLRCHSFLSSLLLNELLLLSSKSGSLLLRLLLVDLLRTRPLMCLHSRCLLSFLLL